MDPYVRDQLGMMKSRMVKNIELVGRHKIEELMNPDAFRATAIKLATLEANEMHFMGCFETADNEPTIEAFEEKYQSLMARPNESNISENPVVQRCLEFCRDHFQRSDAAEVSMNDSQEIAITEAQIATTDPFTKCKLKDPLVNRKCEHVYERATIMELISTNKRLRCPVIGCRNRDFITKEHLYDDPYIRAQLQNQAANDTDEADPDETIEDSEMITLNDSMLPL